MTGNSLKDKVGKLLWSNKADEAEEFLASEESKVDAEIDRLQSELLTQKKRKAEITELSKGRKGYKPNASHSLREKKKRNDQVIALAKKLAVSGTVKTKDIHAEIARKRINLGVSSNRESTAISNILLVAGNFEKVDVGIFRVLDKV